MIKIILNLRTSRLIGYLFVVFFYEKRHYSLVDDQLGLGSYRKGYSVFEVILNCEYLNLKEGKCCLSELFGAKQLNCIKSVFSNFTKAIRKVWSLLFRTIFVSCDGRSSTYNNSFHD